MELNECYNFLDNDVSVCTESDINRYDVEVKEVERKLFGVEMEDQKQQENYVHRDIKETALLIQQDEDESNQQFKTGSTKVQKVDDGRFMPEA